MRLSNLKLFQEKSSIKIQTYEHNNFQFENKLKIIGFYDNLKIIIKLYQ